MLRDPLDELGVVAAIVEADPAKQSFHVGLAKFRRERARFCQIGVVACSCKSRE